MKNRIWSVNGISFNYDSLDELLKDNEVEPFQTVYHAKPVPLSFEELVEAIRIRHIFSYTLYDLTGAVVSFDDAHKANDRELKEFLANYIKHLHPAELPSVPTDQQLYTVTPMDLEK